MKLPNLQQKTLPKQLPNKIPGVKKYNPKLTQKVKAQTKLLPRKNMNVKTSYL